MERFTFLRTPVLSFVIAITFLLAGLFFKTSTGIWIERTDTNRNPEPADVSAILRVVDNRGWEILSGVLRRNPAEMGVFIAPLNIYTLMAMLARASGPRSTCHAQILDYLCSGLSQCNEEMALSELQHVYNLIRNSSLQGPTRTAVANSLWTSPGFAVKDNFKEAMEEYLEAHVGVATDVETINQWASNVTQGLIPELLDPTTSFAIVLATAMYLKAPWFTPFLTHDGETDWFTPYQGGREEVLMMMRWWAGNVRMKANGIYTAVRFDYEGGDFYSVAALPDEGVPLEEVIQRGSELVDGQDNEGWATIPEATLGLPWFNISTSLDLKEYLQDMGITAAFDDHEVDLSRMTSYQKALSLVAHKTLVSVNQTGLEAAAALAGVLPVIAREPLPVHFIPTRPFLFTVYHSKTHALMFAGCVLRDSRFPDKVKVQ